MSIELPRDTVNVQKVCNHLKAYRQGFVEGKAFEAKYISSAFYASPDVVQKGIRDCWNNRLQAPQYIVSYCFNLAGLQDKRDSQEKPNWRECLKVLTEKSDMHYADDVEEKTATLCTLNILEALRKEEGDFAFNLEFYIEQAKKQGKAAYVY